METRSYYLVLGVDPLESVHGIRNAFRELVQRYHPDRAGSRGMPFFQDIIQAYRVLSDPGRRASYDAGLRDGSQRGVARRPSADPSTRGPSPSRSPPPPSLSFATSPSAGPAATRSPPGSAAASPIRTSRSPSGRRRSGSRWCFRRTAPPGAACSSSGSPSSTRAAPARARGPSARSLPRLRRSGDGGARGGGAALGSRPTPRRRGVHAAAPRARDPRALPGASLPRGRPQGLRVWRAMRARAWIRGASAPLGVSRSPGCGD